MSRNAAGIFSLQKPLARDAWFTFFFFILALTSAWWAQRPTAADNNIPVTLFAAPRDVLESFEFRTPKATLNVVNNPKVLGQFLLKFEKPGEQPEDFVAGDNFAAVLHLLTSFQALRSVGSAVPSETELAEFGFTNPPSETLELKQKGSASPILVQVGKASYGTKFLYLRILPVGRIYLAEDALFQDLRRPADRLVERRLFSTVSDGVKQLEASNVSGAVVLLPEKDANASVRGWTVQNQEQLSEAATLFVERLFKLRLMRLATSAQINTLNQSAAQRTGPVVLSVTVRKENGENETLQIFKQETFYGASSSFLQNWVQLSPNRVDPLLQDFQALLTSNKK